MFKGIRIGSNVCKKRVLQLGLVGITLLFFSCVEMPVYQKEDLCLSVKPPAVRVKLLETQNHLSISSNGSLVIRCFHEEGGERAVYYTSAEMEVKLSEEGIELSQRIQGELEADLQKVLFSPTETKFWVCLNGKPYRGVLEITVTKNHESFLVLNLVNVEDYLKGVVASEIGRLSRQEMEALKAQAVAARTYSLSHLGQFAEEGYDLEATVVDQLYRGMEAEDPLTNLAVELTCGQVLTYKGKLICSHYHANSGGRTEFVEKVWSRPRANYLISIDDRDFCSWSKRYTWKESWTKETLKRRIQKFLDNRTDFPHRRLRDLLDLRIKKRSPSGRVQVLEIVTDTGTFEIRGDKIRWALKRGDNPGLILPSTWFDLKIQKDLDGSIKRVIAYGRGNGHGVGMCQVGAIGMARKGYSYQDILRYYYPGTRISNHYGKTKLQDQRLTLADRSVD